jgi:DNA-binding CsgD family transcriptional regulator
MAAAFDAAAERPGLLVVVAPPWTGATRFAAALARRREDDGAVFVIPGAGDTLAERIAAGLINAELRADPVAASRLRPFTLDLGDLSPDDLDAAGAVGRLLTGTDGLLIGCAHEIPAGAAFVALDALDEAAATEVVTTAAPDMDAMAVARVLALGAGRPGVLIALAHANRRSVGDGETLRMPPALLRELEPTIDAIDAEHIDIARWAAVIGGVIEPNALVRLTGRTEFACTQILDELVHVGLLHELTDPGPVRVRFADPLLAEALRQSIPSSELRRRYLAVLNARRAQGDEAPDLVSYAIGTAQPSEVIATSLRASRIARDRGDAAAALRHADRAMAWCGRRDPESVELEAMLEQGLALAGLGRWDQVASVLGQVIRRQRRAGNEAAAVTAATEWARIRWYAGDRKGAFELIENNILEGEGPLAERATALTTAALFASTVGRHTAALEWANRGLAEAKASGDQLAVVRTLNTIGLSTVRATASPDGVSHLREALAIAKAQGHLRQVAVTLNNQCVSLLMLGMVRTAAERAQEGLDIVEVHQIPEIDAPLTHNLAEALVGMGRLVGARRLAMRSKGAFAALGMVSDELLDGLLAWIDFCEGKVTEGLAALRAATANADSGEEATIEAMGSLSAYHVHMAHAAGQIDEAREVAREALEFWRGTDDRGDGLALLGIACEVLPAEEARDAIEELRVAVEAGAPIAAALVPYGEAWLTDDPDTRAELFRQASNLFAHTDLAWWAARTLMLAGEAAGKNPRAIADLLEARRRFREMDAPGWRSRCEAELRTRGHKFVMASRHSDDAGLTEREIQVVEQLAFGLSNQQIADRLFISEKTVGRHLERVFAKLSVFSRTAAVTAVVERGLVAEVADQTEVENAAGSGLLSAVNSAPTTTRA